MFGGDAMLRKNQPALLIKREGDWKMVFCVNQYGVIVTTDKREKALNANYDRKWFENHFGNDEFSQDLGCD